MKDETRRDMKSLLDLDGKNQELISLIRTQLNVLVAKLSAIDIPPKEKTSLTAEIYEILANVNQIAGSRRLYVKSKSWGKEEKEGERTETTSL